MNSFKLFVVLIGLCVLQVAEARPTVLTTTLEQATRQVAAEEKTLQQNEATNPNESNEQTDHTEDSPETTTTTPPETTTTTSKPGRSKCKVGSREGIRSDLLVEGAIGGRFTCDHRDYVITELEYQMVLKRLGSLSSSDGEQRADSSGGASGHSEASSESDQDNDHHHDEVDSSRGPRNDIDCTLCLAALDSETLEMVGLICRHRFHRACIQKWLASGDPNTKRCPICRYIIDSVGMTRSADEESSHTEASSSVHKSDWSDDDDEDEEEEYNHK